MTLGVIALFLLAACGEGPAEPGDAGAREDDAGEVGDDGGAPDAGTGSDAQVADAGALGAIDTLVDLLERESDAAAVDDALHEIAWGAGWPLREAVGGGTRWLFATRWDDAPGGVALVGDVNEWSRAAAPAIRGASGVHWYLVIDESDFAAPAAGAKYKWWGEGEVYRAPSESTAYGYDEFGEHGWVAPPADAPHLERFPALRSAFLDAPRTVRAWLPAGFVARSVAAERARTLLLHDGQNVFDPGAFFGGWRADEALEGGGYDDVVAIAIDNAPDRMSAYTHTSDVIGGGTTGGRAGDYLRVIEDEVLPFARARWGLVARGPSLMIAGSSLGGLVSIWIASVRPELASCVAGLSSTLGWGSIGRSDAGETLIERWSGRPPVAIYLDSGGGPGSGCVDTDGDGLDDDGDGRDNYCETLQMRDVLRAAGYVEGEDLHYAYAAGAGHDEAAWRARLPGALAACTSSGWSAPD